MMSFQKIYGLYGLEHHTVEINGDVTMRTDKRPTKQTSENKATQSMDSVRLSFAIIVAFLSITILFELLDKAGVANQMENNFR